VDIKNGLSPRNTEVERSIPDFQNKHIIIIFNVFSFPINVFVHIILIILNID
jgi:hypothetical protein